MKQHKHAELIKAWADGAEIQVYTMDINTKTNVSTPVWVDVSIHDVIKSVWGNSEFRIKPEPKPDIKWLTVTKWDFEHNQPCIFTNGDFNLEIVFDGETGELKSAEVLK